jgi:hypothetical protein
MSQRDNIPKPGVARDELPRVNAVMTTYLNEVVEGAAASRTR